MLINRKDHLKGQDNKRLHTLDATNSEETAAWQNSETEYKVDQVNKPSLDAVMDAKDWVDNGSKL